MRKIAPEERFVGDRVVLRLVTLADCTDAYVGWLADPEVNRYLETRWRKQTLASVKEFVSQMVVSPDSYLFAMVQKDTDRHVGNIKIGPIHPHHGYADVSYFIGERSVWGKGLATDAVRLATRIGFERLGLHRLQAGLYEGNIGSQRALEKAGYRLEGRFRGQLRADPGPTAASEAIWADHLWYGLLRADDP